MNLLTTLLVYMTVLVASAVQMSPNVTPVPPEFVTPAPVVTSTPFIPPTATPTSFVVPSPMATATATPRPIDTNVLLTVGDRGENVRILQRRLIELGYLSGNADGIFGRQTQNAVERFQNYNNLKVDGIAGPNTLQKLYYDKSVVAAPVQIITPTPGRATAGPIVTVLVPVRYVNEAGTLLYSESLLLQQGITTLSANDSRVPAGYTLQSTRNVRVTVYPGGTAAPSIVTHVYRAPAAATPTPTPVTTPQKQIVTIN